LKTPKIVIADASCLIILSKIRKLELLRLVYSEINITLEVKTEYAESLPSWVLTKEVSDQKYQQFLETELDSGEASTIALGIQESDSLMILDDLKARKVAQKLNLVFTGTLGVISKAKEEGYLTEIKPIIEKILATNFRISDQVVKALLSKYGE
jgi:predicted nucleic acid-binding protein